MSGRPSGETTGCARRPKSGVIRSATPPVTEVIKDGVNGLLFDFYDFAAIADRVDEVLDHKDRMAAIRKKARSTIVQNYELEKCLAEQFKLIENLIEGKRPVASSKPGKPTYRLPKATAASGTAAEAKKAPARGKAKATAKATAKKARKPAASRKTKKAAAKTTKGRGKATSKAT